MMKKKFIKYIISVQLITLLIPKIVLAGVSVTLTDPGNSGDKVRDIPEKHFTLSEKDNVKYVCYYKATGNSSSTMYFEAYNQNDKSIIHNDLSINPILAGTSVGLTIEEKRTDSHALVSFRVEKITTTPAEYGCFKPCTADEKMNDPSCKTKYTSYNNECSSGYKVYTITEESTKTEEVTGGDKYEECHQKARKKAVRCSAGFNASYEIKTTNSNDAGAGDGVKKIEVKAINMGCPTVYPSNDSCSQTCTYNYKPTKVCINILTAEVSYGKKKCNSNTEIEIPNGSDHWHYFTPLNTKNEGTSYVLIGKSGNSSKLSVAQCQSAYDYSNYDNIIVVLDKKGNVVNIRGKSKEKFNSIVSKYGGCYLQTKLTVISKQKFYNEESKKFEGYAYYYRPIDIYDPFPNGVAKNSLWYDGYNSSKNTIKVKGKGEIDLDKSFSKLIYRAKNVSSDKVTKVNEKMYTDWKGINKNGLSEFIKNNTSFIENYANKSDIYNIGCGPANSSWKGCKK